METKKLAKQRARVTVFGLNGPFNRFLLGSFGRGCGPTWLEVMVLMGTEVSEDFEGFEEGFSLTISPFTILIGIHRTTGSGMS